jgi:hypothetical protein
VEPADVVQPAVIGLSDHRVDRRHPLVAGLCQRIGNHRLYRCADAQRVGQHDGRLDRAELLDLGRPGQLAEGVPHEHRPGHLVLEQVARVGQDRRHTGPDGVAFDDRRVPDADALDVGDRIERPGGEDAGLDAQVSRPRPALVAAPDRCDGPGDHKGSDETASSSVHPPALPCSITRASRLMTTVLYFVRSRARKGPEDPGQTPARR